MKIKLSPNATQNILKIGLFIVVAVIIVQLFPRNTKFNYQFEIGKPWTYDLMTASYNFPILKSEKLVASEKEELLKDFSPYYTIDTLLFQNVINKIEKAYNEKNRVNSKMDASTLNQIRNIYAKGILSSNDYTILQETSTSNISFILPSRVSKLINIDEVFTPKSAYEYLLKNGEYDLRTYDLNLFLVPNLKYDSITTEKIKADLLKSLSLTSGIVQAGERIIDRGEIITPESYLVLQSLKKEFDNRKLSIKQSTTVLIGQIIIIVAFIALFFLYIYLFRPRIYDQLKNIIFICLLIVLIIALASFIIRFTALSYFIVPFAILPIIVRVFYDSRTALFAHIITMIIISLMVENSYQFLLLQITIGMVAVSSLKDMTQRSQLTQTALYIFLSYVSIYLATELTTEGNIKSIHLQPIIYVGISSLFLLFAYILIYIFEKLFGLISAVTLVELTNVNSDLLIKFAETAPGTFQHTLQVSNLATEAAKKIGANSLLVRTGALYHDIGKIRHPEYYIENQFGNINPLTEMEFEEAARVIISHVTDGVEIAKKNHLPQQIINFITTHHGLGKAKYFYNSFINAFPDKEPNDAAYTYPGPLPNSKETAILMMADAVEARSRSLKVYTEETINDAVEKMIDSQIADGQFKNAPISFRDVEIVKAVFKEKIKNIYHSRIVYPELKSFELQSPGI